MEPSDRVAPSPMQDDEDLKQRASAGVVFVATRGLVVLVIGFAGTVVIARLLSLHDLGIVAIGLTFVLFTGLVSDGGLGAALIRRAEPPNRRELQALSALQLTITTTIAVLAVVVAAVAPLGRVGWVTAIMVASMPIVALQFPGRILLERSLLYRRLAVVEMTQVLCYHAWNVATVVAGFGVWGLATGSIVRATVATVMMAIVMPAGAVRPVFDRARITPLLGFGLRFQAVNGTMLVRDQVLNLAVAAVAGVATLGQWSLARRVMELPWALFYSMSRVSLPAVPQFLTSGHEPKALVERAVALTAVGGGFVLTAFAGGAPGLIPGVFGAKWAEVSGAVAFACLGVGLTGCLATLQSYLYAVDDAGAVLRAGLVQAPVLLGVSLSLLPVVGVTAVGMGWAVAATLEAVVLGRLARKRAPIRLLPALGAPLAVGVVAGAVGWELSVALGRHLWSGLVGGALAMTVFALGMAMFRRAVLVDTVRFAVQSVRAAAQTVRR